MTGASDFLLELRSEEIPARMQARARADLARLFAEGIGKAGLAAGATATFATPRRLALIARDVAAATAAAESEVKGPRADAPAQAVEGFLRKTGLARGDLVERGGVLFAVTRRPGRAAAAVLAEVVVAIVRGFPWPKSMRWGSASADPEALRWVRPLHGIVAMLGEAVVPLEVAGISSGAVTLGHRFLHPGPITLGGAHDYAAKLRLCHVIVDPAEREAIVRDGARAAAARGGLALAEDEGLVAENAGLTEWPVPLLGRFDPAFLAVPPEVIRLTARVNQKYFVCMSDDGALANAFVCVANLPAPDGGARIVEGNRRVLAARLSDARFFYEGDLTVPLDAQAARLDRVVFHDKLGTLADKVARVAALARWLAETGVVPGADPALAERAARLCKADLVSGMVGEFPELQGVMGGYYAAAQGEDPAVAAAVRDHYQPVGQGDAVPTAPVTVAVSLADKLDTLMCFFAVGEKPTGSKDPFALRRAALAFIRLILDNGLRCSLGDLFETATDVIARDRSADQVVQTRHDELDAVLLDQIATDDAGLVPFFADRLKVQQREAGVRHDLIDAVFALGGEDDLVRLLARVAALQALVGTAEGADLLAGYKRAANILRKEGGVPAGAAPEADPPAAAAALAHALDLAEPAAAAAVAREDFAGAMAALAGLRSPVDAFFDQVTVNDADPARRAGRLLLLDRVRAAMHGVADFSRIEG